MSYVCRNSDGTYDILSTHTKRNERTIGQSVWTLEKNFYVEIQGTKEGKNRSKYILNPTFKGFYYGLAYLGIQIDEIVRAYFNVDEKRSFFENMQKINNYTKMKEYLSESAKVYFENNLFNEGMSVVTNMKDSFNTGLQIGFSAVISQNKSESVRYIHERGLGIADEILGPRHNQDFKNFRDEKMHDFMKAIKEMEEVIRKLNSK